MAPDVSLEFIMDGQVLFSSTGKWLHPLFELEQFLKAREINASMGEIRDKVVGRGSAFLMVRLGVRTAHAGMLSRLGKDVLDHAGVACTWNVIVDEIECQTESILREVTDPEEAYPILAERARKARARAS
jgi:zinc transport system ATP-binding protein